MRDDLGEQYRRAAMWRARIRDDLRVERGLGDMWRVIGRDDMRSASES